MEMPDAATVIGMGVSLFGLGVAMHLGIDAWLRLKRFERDSQSIVRPGELSAEIAARLARIEQMVESSSVEIERIAEGQRFLTRALGEGSSPRVPDARASERIITPH